MFHDTVISSTTDEPSNTKTVERRRGFRVPFPAELLLIWHHDLRSAIRYRITDAGDGGLRIRSAVPLLQGMTGMAMKMLPDGTPIERPVCVAWSSPRDEGDGYEIGLRYF